MNVPNINDPAAVAALLEQLKSSTVWQELTTARSNALPLPESGPVPQESTTSVEGTPQSITSNEPSSNFGGTSVASLLSQLKPFSAGPSVQNPSVAPPPPKTLSARSHASLTSEPFVPIVEDRRHYTFRESLPILSELVGNPSLVEAVKKMKKDQDDLERRLWVDREAIYTKYDGKLKVAQTKAQMIGISVSQHELNMITDAFQKEIRKFDHERVIPAWDGLVARQQAELAQAHVPTMFVTGEAENLERQRQVAGVLETIVGPKA
ncbi:hypothetical protein M413DRAFT_23744 [Hebeloma cylindrosporum]|uniref:Uncharacterized protein n=1 Tax=Hebeloma cylindrosporum TaxID=76867 RepID=A0A0C3CPX4_HEBCY|nr:hypothetical protein M413DRAFT_23744 [Hebeloma cylindrosporum h7]